MGRKKTDKKLKRRNWAAVDMFHTTKHKIHTQSHKRKKPKHKNRRLDDEL